MGHILDMSLQNIKGTPVDTGRKMNVHKTFRRRPGRLLKVLCTFILRPVSTGSLLNLWLMLSQEIISPEAPLPSCF